MNRVNKQNEAEIWPVDNMVSRHQQLEYLAEMASELRKIALGAGADTLAHVLEVASMEAELQLKIHREAVSSALR